MAKLSTLSVLFTSLLSAVVSAQNSTAQNATAFALTYGYPLLSYERVLVQLNTTGANKFSHGQQLSNADNRTVVRPNIDTLYSTLVFDLSENDVVVTVPRGIPSSQFLLFSYFDPYGTNFANTGTLNFNNSGDYRLQPRTSTTTSAVTPVNGTGSAYQATINSPSIYGYVVIRWLVNNTNINAIHNWQNQTTTQTISVSPRAPALKSLPLVNATATPAQNVLRLLAAFAPYTLLDNSTQAKLVNTTLTAAGLAKGIYTPPSDVNITLANTTAVASIAASVPGAFVTLNNGWVAANGSILATFGTNYGFRAATATDGYLAITSPNAIYPSWANASAGGSSILPLAAKGAYIYTFSSKPPLQSTGFWSLTAYQDGYLIKNTLNIYGVTSERSNITYSDGTFLYGTNASTKTQSFQLLVQPADVPPPSNWTGNWLPGPAGGGNISVTLRLYDADQTLLSGNWQYPVVTQRSAITNGTNGTSSTNTTGGATGTASPSGSKTSAAATSTSTSSANAQSVVNWLLLAVTYCVAMAMMA